MRTGNRIIAGIGIFTVLGLLLMIGTGQVGFGEGMAILIVLAIFVLPGLINLTR